MAKHAPTLARGYTRAMDYIFDSDDDTPIPELPIVTSPAVTAHPGGISPSSDAAPMAKSAASATRRESVQPTPPPPAPPCLGRSEQNRPHDYAAGTDSVHVQAAVSAKPPPIRSLLKVIVSEHRSERSHKNLKPPHPSWPASPAPEPAKGCMRDMPESPSAYVRPRISKGYHHVSDGAPWRGVAIKEQKRPWPLWGRGVVDLRPHSLMVAGRLLRHALGEAKRIIRIIACEHKVGMCKCPYDRFMLYQDDEASWQPWVMCLLASTTTREGSFFLEASLIYSLENDYTNIDHNINWLRSCDYGGEGPRLAADADEEHFVYLAVRPIPSDEIAIAVPVADRLQQPT